MEAILDGEDNDESFNPFDLLPDPDKIYGEQQDSDDDQEEWERYIYVYRIALINAWDFNSDFWVIRSEQCVPCKSPNKKNCVNIE